MFRVEARGTGLRFEWQERRGQSAWGPAAGQESALAESSELRVMSLASEPSQAYYRALIRNGAGEVASAEARLDVVWGTVETLEPNIFDLSREDGGGSGGGDGGTSGGGDGGSRRAAAMVARRAAAMVARRAAAMVARRAAAMATAPALAAVSARRCR